MKILTKISGLFIFLSFIITLYSYFINSDIFIYAGIFAWISFLLLFSSIVNKKLIYLLSTLTILAFLFSYINDFSIDLKKVILVNQYLLTLLIGVGFLRLIATPKKEKIKKLPTGKESFLKTYLGIHLFGSVINLSSLVLVADKLYKKAPLSNLQVILLTRAFSSDAYWSPFFVAFAAAIVYAPNLSPQIIFLNGLFLALIAFIITYLEVIKNKKFDIENFKGYPVHFETLYIPLLLAILVLITNYYYPSYKVILLISIFSLLMTMVMLPFKLGFFKSIKTFSYFISDELPKMKNELALFLVAGAFGVAISSILYGLNIDLPFEVFDGFIASILLLCFILLSFIGIHPIITIAVIGSWMSEVNHTLLAITFLMAWSTAVSTSPFSGLNLTMQARYNLKAKDIFILNIPYAIKMYIVCVIILFILEKFLKI